VRIDVHTNVQPIVAGDDISISIHLDTWEKLSTLGYGVAVSMPAQRTIATFVPITSGFDYPWTADVVGQQVVFQVILYPVVHSGLSAPVTINPAVPVLTAPADEELLHAGSQYTFRWTQVPPAPTHYRLRFSTDGAQTFPELGDDFSGSVDHVTRTVPGTPTDHGLVRLEGLWPGFDPLFDPPISVKTTDQIVLHVGTPPPWHIGEDGTVNWTAAGDVDHFEVELTRDGGQSWTTLASNVPGSQHHLTVGVDPPVSTHCRVRVHAFGAAHSTTALSGVFRITGAPVRHGRQGPRD
jgi:hypothetical protein